MCKLQVFSCYRGRKEACRATRAFQKHQDTSCNQVFVLQGKALKEIQAILTETLGEYAPSYATVKNWVAQFNPLNAELNPICNLLSILGDHYILSVSS
jgi:hypothetical protein